MRFIVRYGRLRNEGAYLGWSDLGYWQWRAKQKQAYPFPTEEAALEAANQTTAHPYRVVRLKENSNPGYKTGLNDALKVLERVSSSGLVSLELAKLHLDRLG